MTPSDGLGLNMSITEVGRQSMSCSESTFGKVPW